ncbi:Acetyltransferase (GNAT) family protein [Pseudonocardia thermophila]|uniref:Acetyltransferase (GNAT) family protein n=1 Tax=Pseudonocardia thermophila TaxID=1848 RepID=A0A1M6WRX6_PSETH|nr:GNAT family N-acetyltransferase [Pseudonocardia thermophila]SHK96468.1 Acetyltransferase (GNAT) family protein [Pseudonocardia thermophila]
MLELRRVPIDHPDARQLINGLFAFYGEVYGGEGDATPVDVAEFSPPRGAFYVGYLDGEPVACGGWRARDHDPADPQVRDGDAEIKRMYVAPGHRGRGFARAVLTALEESAAAAGRTRAILETGSPQTAAIRLYEAAGYTRIPGFGRYRRSPLSRCFAKLLVGARTSVSAEVPRSGAG